MHRATLARFFAILFLFLTPLSAAAQLLPQSGAPEAAAQADPLAGLTAEQAGALAEVLRNAEVRDRLIGALEAAAAGTEGAETAEPATAEPATAVSLGRRIAEFTQATSEGIARTAMNFWELALRAPNTLTGAMDVPAVVVFEAVNELLLVILSTVGVYFALRMLAKPLFRRMGRAAERGGAARTVLLILAAVAIDAAVVLIAWASGYALGLLAFGEAGSIAIRQSLYLNAFLIVEMLKVAIRGVFAPTAGRLRIVNVQDRAARRISRWLGIVVSLLGYGQLLVVPIVNQSVSYAAGRGVSALFSALALGIMLALVLVFRKAVADWLIGGRLEERNGLLRFLARIWHVPALIYLVVVLVIVLARPGNMLVPVMVASAKILGIVLAGMVISGALGRAIARGVHLPQGVTARLPLLEQRLNTFLPRVLTLVRVAVVVTVIAAALTVVGIADLPGWLQSQIGLNLTGKMLSIALILAVAFAVWLAYSSWIDFRLNPSFGRPASSREQTLLSLLRNALTVVLVVFTLMFVLSEIGIDIAPLIASAGVLGLAIGFGAQKLVQDIITGVFIQLENAMNVGDVVTVGSTSGVVERLTIRSVSLRDVNGTFHIIPFSSVDMVSNNMRDFGFYVADIGIAYREDIDEAKQAMLDAFETLRATPEHAANILEDLQWMGVQSLGDNAVVLRARIKAVAGTQWGLGRAYLEAVKKTMDAKGIEIPFPQQTVWFGEDREGEAPPLRIRRAGPRKAAAPEGDITLSGGDDVGLPDEGEGGAR